MRARTHVRAAPHTSPLPPIPSHSRLLQRSAQLSRFTPPAAQFLQAPSQLAILIAATANTQPQPTQRALPRHVGMVGCVAAPRFRATAALPRSPPPSHPLPPSPPLAPRTPPPPSRRVCPDNCTQENNTTRRGKRRHIGTHNVAHIGRAHRQAQRCAQCRTQRQVQHQTQRREQRNKHRHVQRRAQRREHR